MKWAAWAAVYCSFISYANSRGMDDAKQLFSSFMYTNLFIQVPAKTLILSICLCRLAASAVIMSYLQNPGPMQMPW